MNFSTGSACPWTRLNKCTSLWPRIRWKNWNKIFSTLWRNSTYWISHFLPLQSKLTIVWSTPLQITTMPLSPRFKPHSKIRCWKSRICWSIGWIASGMPIRYSKLNRQTWGSQSKNTREFQQSWLDRPRTSSKGTTSWMDSLSRLWISQATPKTEKSSSTRSLW